MRLPIAGLTGFVVNVVVLTFYSLSQQNSMLYALGVGIIWGGLFTMMAASIAMFFRTNPPA